jgi:hypothetical protein
MNKKCICMTGLLLFSLICFDCCEAEEISTLNDPEQAVAVEKKAAQNDNATSPSPRETTKHMLPPKRGALLHIAFEKGYIGKGVMLEPVVLQDAYTIEVIVKPYGKQVSQAVILGNICGNEEGFVIQQSAMEQNIYTMAFNDGGRWYSSVKFKLKEGTWNYIAVVFGDMNVLQVYVDGSLVGTVATKNKIKNTSQPLRIGNWAWGYWPFSGKIAEVRIANSPLEEKDIAMRWSKLKPRLPNL